MLDLILRFRLPPPPPPPPPQPTTTVSTLPRNGLVVTVIGLAVIFLSAVAYFFLHNATVGAVGLVFVIVIVYFLYRGRKSADPQTRMLTGIVPMFLGFIIMILDGTALNFDIVVLLGGLLLTIGGVLLSAKK